MHNAEEIKEKTDKKLLKWELILFKPDRMGEVNKLSLPKATIQLDENLRNNHSVLWKSTKGIQQIKKHLFLKNTEFQLKTM